MGTIRSMRVKLGKIDLNTQLPKIISKTAPDIIRFNTIEQLFKLGEDSKGFKLPPYKSKVYAADKVFMNPGLPFGQPDLKLSGAFYSAFYVTFENTSAFYINSSDEKAKKLEQKYGKDIYGLNDENKRKYAKEVVYPRILEYIRSKIRGSL